MSEMDDTVAPHLRLTDEMLEMIPKVSDEEAIGFVPPQDLPEGVILTNKDNRNNRLQECLGCERLFKPTKTCRECGCFMVIKTWVKDATCPLNKW